MIILFEIVLSYLSGFDNSQMVDRMPATMTQHQPCPLHHSTLGGAGGHHQVGGHDHHLRGGVTGGQTKHIRGTNGLQLSDWSHVPSSSGHMTVTSGQMGGSAVKGGGTRTLGNNKFNLNRKQDLLDERDFSLDTEKPYF